MNRLQVQGDLLMHDRATFEEIDLNAAKIDGFVTMGQSVFSGKLTMDSIWIGRDLRMAKATFGEVNLRGAKIGEQLDMIGSAFAKNLNMNGVQVEQNLFMRDKANFGEVDLGGAKIGGQLDMCGSTFAEVNLGGAKIGGLLAMRGSTFGGKLIMKTLQVQESLFMDDRATFEEVDLRVAKVGGSLRMDGSAFSGKVDMNTLQIGQHLQMRNGAIFHKDITLELAEIGGNLELSGSTFASVSLKEAKVVGALLLGPPAPSWSEVAKLSLQNAQVGFLHYSPDVWPRNIELDGFTYANLGGLSEKNDGQINTRDTGWFKGWLKRQTKFTPQPYENLANVLEKEGHKGEAKDVLYAGKNRELEQASDRLSWFWLFLHKIFIGYGYRIHYSFCWTLGFILVGMFVLRITKQGPANKMPYGLAYSTDMLLPIVKLREKHYEIDLKGFARYYFYFHRIMGYVLVSFLIAGLTGLTKQ
jgi:uncharacterized protein YjbI with pentapeptide repeats